MAVSASRFVPLSRCRQVAALLALALACPAGTAVAQDCDPPVGGLVAWYPADGSAADLAGGNDGALQNGAGFGEGRSGQAFQLDGDDDFVAASGSGATDPVFAGTLAAWVNLDERPSDAGHEMTIIGRGGDGDDFDLFVDTTNQFRFSVGDGVGVGSSRIAKMDTWYHLVATWSSGDGLRFYVNGALEGTNGVLVEREGGEQPLRIGDHAMSGPSRLAGRIDDVKIFDRALDAFEVADLRCVFPGICGDANNDSSVKSSDALSVLRFAVGQDVTCPAVRCDTDADGVVRASDSLRTLQFAVGQEVLLDCPLP